MGGRDGDGEGNIILHLFGDYVCSGSSTLLHEKVYVVVFFLFSGTISSLCVYIFVCENYACGTKICNTGTFRRTLFSEIIYLPVLMWTACAADADVEDVDVCAGFFAEHALM